MQKEYFSEIPDIQDRRRAFLKDTVEHYNKDNRSETDTGCLYYPAKRNSKGCAIGRWLDKDLAKKMDGAAEKFNHIFGTDIGSLQSVFKDELPNWMLEMGIYFLIQVQLLHDVTKNWDKKGITDSGLEEVAKIEKNFLLS